MTTLYTRKKAFDDSNMIPMINVVFLLLIFFMIAGQIKPNLPADINLPTADVDTPAELNTPQVVINERGEVTFDGETISIEHLESVVNKMTADGVSLIVDKNLTAKNLDPILNIFRRSGSSEVKLFLRHSSDQS